MIDWLRRDPFDTATIRRSSSKLDNPSIDIAGHTLPIALRRHKRARRLTMRLAPDGSELRITLPSWGRSLDALAFAKERAGWIAEQLDKVPDHAAIRPGALVAYRGEELVIDWREGTSRQIRHEAGRLALGGPQERIEARVQRWLEQEALGLCADDLDYFCHRAGRAKPELRLSRARRRWGSCSGNTKAGLCIRINWRLVMAPDHVRRSVVAHEVAHLTHFDHSPAFHAHLSEVFDGDIASADKWLKTHGRALYASFS